VVVVLSDDDVEPLADAANTSEGKGKVDNDKGKGKCTSGESLDWCWNKPELVSWRSGRDGGTQRWSNAGGKQREWYRAFYVAKGVGRSHFGRSSGALL
jgi:hypothetical protein